MTAHTHDDGFHEIQLNGKQLVFVFMAATVVSAVVFLCGVFVGRGVRVERSALAQTEVLSQSPTADVPPTRAVFTPAPAQTVADPTVAAPPPTVNDSSDGKRPEESVQAADELKPAAPRPALVSQGARVAPVEKAAPAQQPAVVQKSVPAQPSAPADKAAPVEKPVVGAVSVPSGAKDTSDISAGSGYAVQVAALNVRGEADAIAKRLAAKGYAAYVQASGNGTSSMFRVRVGTFKTRHEAETVAAKLQKEEQIKPWVTR